MIDRPSRRNRDKPRPLRMLRLADRVLARLPVVRAMLPADMPPGPALISSRKISSRPGWARAERAETASVGSMVREYPNCVTPPRRLAAPTRRRRNGSWLGNDFVFPVARRLAEREERLPTHAGRIAHPGLVGLGVATGRRDLVDSRLTGGFEAAGDFSQFTGGLGPDGHGVDAGRTTSWRECEGYAWVVERGPFAMTFSVNTNMGAMIALQNLNATSSDLQTVQGRISTGLKVASAKDNGAIWAIAQSQRAQSASLDAVKDSLQRGQSISDVAIAAGGTVSALLVQMKAKALPASDTSLDTASRNALNEDFKSLRDQITTVVQNAVFNGFNLIDGSTTKITALASTDGSRRITVNADKMKLSGSVVTVKTTSTISTA